MSKPLAVTRMTFDEEFNSFSNAPNASSGTWMTAYPYGGLAARTLSGNSEGQYYSDSSVGANPFSLVNGVLTISATPGSNSAGLPYNSGVITTSGSFSQTYGYFEVSAQLPSGQGLWPAFWMLPASISYSAELDIFEVIGSSPDVVNATVHGWYGNEWDAHLQAFKVSDTSKGFHTYGADWEPDVTTYYVDGKVVGAVATPTSMNDPMFMILNLAVGGKGSWPGAPDGSTQFPAKFDIDYVRAYATANTTYVGGRAAIPAGSAQAANAFAFTTGGGTASSVVAGSGPNSITLSMSEDAYQGDAQFTVSVNGVQQGGVQTVTARHGQGAPQQFVVKGDFSGARSVEVKFQNDAYGGNSGADRNLYVDSASFDGSSMTPNGGALYSNGSLSFVLPGAPDKLTLRMTEDAWHGDAQAQISLDGKTLGTVTVTAAHNGAAQELSFTGNFGIGGHTVGVNFLNDAYGGNGADRNLYLQGISLNGTDHPGATANLYSGGLVELRI